MSKKLIAVASAAALALSALVAVPATAMPFGESAQTGNSITISDSGNRASGAGTISEPITMKVPEEGTVVSVTTLRFDVSSDVKSRAFTVTSTSGIKLLDAVNNATNKYTAASGSASLALTTNSTGKAEFIAFPTSTTKGVITVTLDGDVTQIYMTGTVGVPYDLTTVVLPSVEPSKTGVITAVVKDAFGNEIQASGATIAPSFVGTGGASASNLAYSSTTKRYETTLTAGSVAGSLAVGLALSVSEDADRKAAFGDPEKTFFGIIQVAAAKTTAMLSAEVAALQTQLAASVTKAKYNKLVKRWNKKNPNNKVKLAK